jgi:hypothetical protein
LSLVIHANERVILFSTGYVPVDASGDGIIDSSDMIILDNNSTAFVERVVPF